MGCCVTFLLFAFILLPFLSQLVALNARDTATNHSITSQTKDESIYHGSTNNDLNKLHIEDKSKGFGDTEEHKGYCGRKGSCEVVYYKESKDENSVYTRVDTEVAGDSADFQEASTKEPSVTTITTTTTSPQQQLARDEKTETSKWDEDKKDVPDVPDILRDSHEESETSTAGDQEVKAEGTRAETEGTLNSDDESVPSDKEQGSAFISEGSESKDNQAHQVDDRSTDDNTIPATLEASTDQEKDAIERSDLHEPPPQHQNDADDTTACAENEHENKALLEGPKNEKGAADMHLSTSTETKIETPEIDDKPPTSEINEDDSKPHEAAIDISAKSLPVQSYDNSESKNETGNERTAEVPKSEEAHIRILAVIRVITSITCGVISLLISRSNIRAVKDIRENSDCYQKEASQSMQELKELYQSSEKKVQEKIEIQKQYLEGQYAKLASAMEDSKKEIEGDQLKLVRSYEEETQKLMQGYKDTVNAQLKSTGNEIWANRDNMERIKKELLQLSRGLEGDIKKNAEGIEEVSKIQDEIKAQGDKLQEICVISEDAFRQIKTLQEIMLSFQKRLYVKNPNTCDAKDYRMEGLVSRAQNELELESTLSSSSSKAEQGQSESLQMYSDSKYRWKQSPKYKESYLTEEFKYCVDGSNPRIATKDGKNGEAPALGDVPLLPNKVTSWTITVLKGTDDMYIGVATLGVHDPEGRSPVGHGWFFNTNSSSLYSGPPHLYIDINYGSYPYSKVNTGDSACVVMDTARGELSFVVKGVNYGVAYEGIPLDEPLFPCAILKKVGDSVEIGSFRIIDTVVDISLTTPTKIKVRDITRDSITLTWGNVRGATHYQIEVDGSSNWGTSAVNEFTKGGLLPDTEHTIRVRTVVGISVSVWSRALVVRTLEDSNASSGGPEGRTEMAVLPGKDWVMDITGMTESDLRKGDNIKKVIRVEDVPKYNTHKFTFINSKTRREYEAGYFYTDTIENMQNEFDHMPGDKGKFKRCSLVVDLRGDVESTFCVNFANLQAKPAHNGDMFQVETCFNGVESKNARYYPDAEDYLSSYVELESQGSVASVSAGAATISRVLLPFYNKDTPAETWRQTRDKQVELLGGLGEKAKVINGFVVLGDTNLGNPRDTWDCVKCVRVGVQVGAQVVYAPVPKKKGEGAAVGTAPAEYKQYISQVFCSAAKRNLSNNALYEAAYRGTYLAALRHGAPRLFLTLVGNEPEENFKVIEKVHTEIACTEKNTTLKEVHIVLDNPSVHMHEFISSMMSKGIYVDTYIYERGMKIKIPDI